MTLAAVGAVAMAGLSAWATSSPDGAADASAAGSTAVTGDVLVGVDGRTLTASVFWNGCEDRPTLVAAETSSAVTLQVVRHRHAPPDAVCDNGQAQHLSVSLDHPLGNRSLGGPGHTSDTSTFMAKDLRQPGYLPAGYSPTSDVMANVDSATVHVDRDGAHFLTSPTPSWERGYASGHEGILIITETVGESTPTTGASVSVNGHLGHFTVRPATGRQLGETLSWFDGTYTMTIQEQDPDLTEADVLWIAQGLH
ncbi:hypothetical protein [Streptacidiphilus jiangxiensis]|uniref:hypothetical protein n=1 Tax=Streptacidiphilus jiangxiensis TaxID=235985 RepID=UPI001269F632|nr:hypothetical protein [Streptacidiphilus jiangxiensis]